MEIRNLEVRNFDGLKDLENSELDNVIGGIRWSYWGKYSYKNNFKFRKSIKNGGNGGEPDAIAAPATPDNDPSGDLSVASGPGSVFFFTLDPAVGTNS